MKYADMTEEQKEKRRQYMREYYQTHREACKLAAKRWRINNPGMRTGNSPEYRHQYWIKNKERLMQKRRKKNPPKMVRVVRCMECKWNSGTPHNPWCENDNCHRGSFWFCADGERKE